VHNENLKRHIRKFHELDKGFMCSFCGEVFGDARALSDHELRLHATEFEDEAAVTAAEVGAIRSYGCSLCHRTFARTSHLRKHEARVHDSDSRPGVACVSTDCDAVFDNKYNMRRHVSVVHRTESIYDCEMCHKQFGFLQHLNTHRSVDHGITDGVFEVQDPWFNQEI
jgi:DNA-directed RNA polymerase subunit RPC12/RpoP